ncbi:hypothetical protein GOP47_0025345 [Adiantum capillus-veneris]|uniref:MORN repeat-containing protein n=1 Tax=Adiantum capillus-veneris TaxID=13818 RepID=A0A9D4U2M3_ADICA|nr:hypothetical protein GOP47_0025345 [Adiantum capillus-veneris]
MSAKKPKAAAKPSVASVAPPVASEPTRGTGKFYYKNGATYEGEWIFDANVEPLMPTPQSQDSTTTPPPTGTFKCASGALYEGQWKMGVYCGTGTYKWPDGRCYSGDWRDNKMHGNGVYVDKDGHKWTGDLR